MIDPVPNMSKALFLTLLQERRVPTPMVLMQADIRTIVFDQNAQHTAFAFNKPQGRKKFWNTSNKPHYTYYNRDGHTVDKYFEKHGFPSNYKPQDSNRGGLQGRLEQRSFLPI